MRVDGALGDDVKIVPRHKEPERESPTGVSAKTWSVMRPLSCRYASGTN